MFTQNTMFNYKNLEDIIAEKKARNALVTEFLGIILEKLYSQQKTHFNEPLEIQIHFLMRLLLKSGNADFP